MIKIQNFIKGFLMGVCDIIPGISGGTIAFITGIYERLISSVKSFSFELLFDVFAFIFFKKRNNTKKLKKDLKKLDLVFLLTVVSGILSAILLTSRIMTYLLDTQYVLTMSFFIGLISSSSLLIYSQIKNHTLSNLFMGFLGLLFMIIVLFFRPIEIVNPSLFYLYIGGLLGISAMFLPGISGAFILLILGLYRHLLNYLHDIPNNLLSIIVFCLGIITGTFVISRIINFLFKHYKCKTLYFLLGLVLGSLFIPLKEIILKINRTVFDINLSITFFLLGILIVALLEFWNHKKKKDMLITVDSS